MPTKTKTRVVLKKPRPKAASHGARAAVKKRAVSRPKLVVPFNLPVVSDDLVFGASLTDLPTEAESPTVLDVPTSVVLEVAAPSSAPIAPEVIVFPNTTPVQPIQVEIKSDGALLKSAKAGFYLGVIIGVMAMSLLVIIAYISFLTNLIY